MKKLAHILLIAMSISAIFSWAAIAYMWSDQQRLATTVNQWQSTKDQSATEQLSKLLSQTAESTNDLEKRVELLEMATLSATQQATVVRTNNAPTAQVGEYFVSLGSGQTNHTDWTDLDGTAVWVDASKYTSSAQAYFEGNLSIQGGEVHARLKNKTTGAILAVTEISNNTRTSENKVSPIFYLHPGNNEYVVQIKSSSREWASIESARIRIVIN